jgi:hypothetical protein
MQFFELFFVSLLRESRETADRQQQTIQRNNIDYGNN